MTTAAIAEDVERELAKIGSLERAAKERAYLKSELAHLGVPVPVLRARARAIEKEHDLDHDALIGLVDALWAREIHELRAMAVMLLDRRRLALGPADVPRIELLLRESRTWALVDELAVRVVGALHARFPAELGLVLDRWAEDPDFWLRRTAMLALLPELRRGRGEFDRFARYADLMLEEREFFVRKAIGWVLRESGKARPALVVEWLGPRAHRASGVTMREAVKYLPDDARERLLAAAKRSAKRRR